ncbi:MAG: ABC transporter permease [Capsulimonadales bacterium]|nr:ABC transporter permease [Capsulimonadales bacterium]
MGERWRRASARYLPELTVTGLLAVALLLSGWREPRFWDAAYLFDRSTLHMETGLLTLTMTLVILAGQIDLSVTSILALVGALLATLHVRFGVPMTVLLPFGPIFGGLLGSVNGYLVARRGLPSLVVTLATMALFRGIAQILLGDRSVMMPPEMVGIERVTLPKSYLHAPLLLLIVATVAAYLLLHRTVFGRYVTVIGVNPEAARYSGVPVARTMIRLFVLSGAMAGLCSLLLLSRLGVARYDHARGWELDVITAVVLGGTSIFGGRGTIYGSIAAFLLIAIVQTGMGVAGVKAEIQVTAIGFLLLLAIFLAKVTERGR